MEPSELLGIAAKILDSLSIPYFTTRSMASMRYGEPRFTNDIDIVIDINPSLVAPLCSKFPAEDYYVSAEAVHEAIKRRSQFNVIHPASGLKIDFMVAADNDFNRSRFERVQSVQLASGQSAHFASPEDVILRKLEYYKQGGSDKHLRDIRGILNLCDHPIDTEYISHWAERLSVIEQWRVAQEQ